MAYAVVVQYSGGIKELGTLRLKHALNAKKNTKATANFVLLNVPAYLSLKNKHSRVRSVGNKSSGNHRLLPEIKPEAGIVPTNANENHDPANTGFNPISANL